MTVWESLKGKANEAGRRAREFEERPPVWGYIVAGLVVWIALQTVKAIASG